ncbi:MAG TPA: ribonuclease P protein subunit [Thermoplasmata archaeon]|jgi:ribonuclease P protein subunit POP4
MSVTDFRRREFIGLEAEVVESSCAEYVGIKGRVVDETKNMLRIERDGVERSVPKDCCKFRFADGPRTHIISGKDIKFRPEDRIKRVR